MLQLPDIKRQHFLYSLFYNLIEEDIKKEMTKLEHVDFYDYSDPRKTLYYYQKSIENK